jgi:hypothetical protein
MHLSFLAKQQHLQFLVSCSSLVFIFYFILHSIPNFTLFSIENESLKIFSLTILFLLALFIYINLVQSKKKLNKKNITKINLSLNLSIFGFLMLPVSLFAFSTMIFILNAVIIVILLVIDLSQYDLAFYLLIKNNNNLIFRLIIFLSIILLFFFTGNIIFFFLSFLSFEDTLYSGLLFGLNNVANVSKKYFVLIKNNLLNWIKQIIFYIVKVIYSLLYST